MKVGDVIPVTIGGHTVTNATVRELGDGTATLVVPGTLVVMATRTTLDDAPVVPSEPEKETIITGVDRASGGDTIEPQTQEAPVEESTQPSTAAPSEVRTAEAVATNDGAGPTEPEAPSGEPKPETETGTNAGEAPSDSSGNGETQ